MIQQPTLVQDVPLTRMANSVIVGTMKFTVDQFNTFFNAQNPAPARLAQQLAEFSAAYDNLNASYALTRESLITIDIHGLDEEGDQLFLAVKETTIAAQRMTYLLTKKQAGDRMNIVLKKYSIDVKDNMISEWSKIQQFCEECNASALIAADLITLGLIDVMARLTEIADTLRQRLTERSGEMPALRAMKQARERIAPEYRALIQLLNAFALVDSDTQKYRNLIQTLNGNIDYVRVHAMTDGGSTVGNGGADAGSNGSSGSGSSSGGSESGGSSASGSGDSGSGSGSGTGGTTPPGGDDGGGDDIA